MTGPLRALARRVRQPVLDAVEQRDEAVRLAIGRAESRAVRAAAYDDLRDAEFRVFSQFGEDGIIQHLLGRVPVAEETFVEIGVEDYRESNTRFLAMSDGWRGVIFDAGTAHVDYVRRPTFRWRYPVEARQAFVTRDNVNDLIADAGLRGDIGLLSVDIDGNDCWVLEALEVVRPRIIVAEYNSVLGPHDAVAVPYDPSFDRSTAHWSHLYWGASLPALAHVAAKQGYELVGSNGAGNNAFFVRTDVRAGLTPVAAADAWVRSRFREARDRHGALSFVDSHREGLDAIRHLELVDVVTGERRTVGDLRRR